MSYFVYNTGRGRSATHISKDRRVTLCGLAATRHVDVFGPAEASCRECRKRWQIAKAALTSTRMAAPAQTTRATGKTLPIDVASPPLGDGRPRAKKTMGSRAFMAVIATASGAAVYGLALLMRICYDHGLGNECHSALACGSRYTGSSATPASVFSAFGCLGIGLLILGAGIIGITCLVNAVRPSLVRNFSFAGDRTSRSQHHATGNFRILS
jgi:hypothetical protein